MTTLQVLLGIEKIPIPYVTYLINVFCIVNQH